MSNGTSQSVAKLLADAHRLAGNKAVVAAERQDYVKAHEWKALAIEVQALLRDAVELMAE